MRTPLIAPLMILSACASTPDPAEICTSTWVEDRTNQAMTRIEQRLDTALDAFKSVGEQWLQGKTPGPVQMFRLSNAAKALERELEDGRGIRDLRTISSTCDDPDLIRNQIYALLDREGVPDDMVNFLGSVGILDEIVRVAEGDTTTRKSAR